MMTAVAQINRNIELIRYRKFGDDLLLLESTNAATAKTLEHQANAMNERIDSFQIIGGEALPAARPIAAAKTTVAAKQQSSAASKRTRRLT